MHILRARARNAAQPSTQTPCTMPLVSWDSALYLLLQCPKNAYFLKVCLSSFPQKVLLFEKTIFFCRLVLQRILLHKNVSFFFSSENASLRKKKYSFANWSNILASFRVNLLLYKSHLLLIKCTRFFIKKIFSGEQWISAKSIISAPTKPSCFSSFSQNEL